MVSFMVSLSVEEGIRAVFAQAVKEGVSHCPMNFLCLCHGVAFICGLAPCLPYLELSTCPQKNP